MAPSTIHGMALRYFNYSVAYCFEDDVERAERFFAALHAAGFDATLRRSVRQEDGRDIAIATVEVADSLGDDPAQSLTGPALIEDVRRSVG